MARGLCIICLILVVTTVRSQVIYERTYPDEFPSIKFPIELSDFSTISFDKYDYWCNGINARHIDANGNELENNFGFEAFYWDLHYIGNDSILIWYEEGSHDVGPDSFKVIIWTPDSVRLIHRQNIDYEPFGKLYGAFLYQSSRIILQIADTLFLKNLAHNEIVDTEILPGIEKIYELKDGILVLTANGKAYLYNSSLERINTLTFNLIFLSSFYAPLVLDSFLINIDSSKNLEFFNVFTEDRYTMELSSVFDSIIEFQANQGFLYLHGIKSQLHTVVQLNASHEILSNKTLDIPVIKDHWEFQFLPTRVYAWAYDGLGAYKANYRICYRYTDPSDIQVNDVALDSVWIENITFLNHFQILKIACQISNYSEDTIRNVTLHYDINEPYSTCFSGTNANHFYNLNIHPGDSIQLLFDSYSTALTHSNSLKRGYFVEHGNHHLDDYTANNHFQLIYLASSVNPVIENFFSIWPNPFQDYLETFEDFESLELYNSFGNLILTGINRLDKLENLPAGTYYVKGQRNQKSFFSRVVKVE